jgi:hypothetical protein
MWQACRYPELLVSDDLVATRPEAKGEQPAESIFIIGIC